MEEIIIVEDDSLLNRMLTYNLNRSNYLVTSVLNIHDAKQEFEKKNFDMALLDVNLDDGSGYDLCKWIKTRCPNTLIIFITAKDREEEQIYGYKAGAVDYITKPFSIEALQYKINAMFHMIASQDSKREIFDDGFLRIDFTECRSFVNGNEIALTTMEYKVLHLLCMNPRQVLTRRLILEKLWDINENFVNGHALTTVMSRLRNKIEIEDRVYIKTVYGMGYLWTGGMEH